MTPYSVARVIREDLTLRGFICDNIQRDDAYDPVDDCPELRFSFLVRGLDGKVIVDNYGLSCRLWLFGATVRFDLADPGCFEKLADFLIEEGALRGPFRAIK